MYTSLKREHCYARTAIGLRYVSGAHYGSKRSAPRGDRLPLGVLGFRPSVRSDVDRRTPPASARAPPLQFGTSRTPRGKGRADVTSKVRGRTGRVFVFSRPYHLRRRHGTAAFSTSRDSVAPPSYLGVRRDSRTPFSSGRFETGDGVALAFPKFRTISFLRTINRPFWSTGKGRRLLPDVSNPEGARGSLGDDRPRIPTGDLHSLSRHRRANVSRRRGTGISDRGTRWTPSLIFS